MRNLVLFNLGWADLSALYSYRTFNGGRLDKRPFWVFWHFTDLCGTCGLGVNRIKSLFSIYENDSYSFFSPRDRNSPEFVEEVSVDASNLAVHLITTKKRSVWIELTLEQVAKKGFWLLSLLFFSLFLWFLSHFSNWLQFFQMPVLSLPDSGHVIFEHFMEFFVIYGFIFDTLLSCFFWPWRYNRREIELHEKIEQWKRHLIVFFVAMSHHWSLIFGVILICVHLIKDSSYDACFATINSSLIMNNKWVNHESVMSHYRSDFCPIRYLMPIGALFWDNRREEDQVKLLSNAWV